MRNETKPRNRLICFVTQGTKRTCVTARLVSDVSVRKLVNCLQIHVLFIQDATDKLRNET